MTYQFAKVLPQVTKCHILNVHDVLQGKALLSNALKMDLLTPLVTLLQRFEQKFLRWLITVTMTNVDLKLSTEVNKMLFNTALNP